MARQTSFFFHLWQQNLLLFDVSRVTDLAVHQLAGERLLTVVEVSGPRFAETLTSGEKNYRISVVSAIDDFTKRSHTTEG